MFGIAIMGGCYSNILGIGPQGTICAFRTTRGTVLICCCYNYHPTEYHVGSFRGKSKRLLHKQSLQALGNISGEREIRWYVFHKVIFIM